MTWRDTHNTSALNALKIPVDDGVTPGGSYILASELVGATGQGFTVRGAWLPLTTYAAFDVLTNGGQTYEVTSPFTSGMTFDTGHLMLWAAKGAPGQDAVSTTTPPTTTPTVTAPGQVTGLTVGTTSTTTAPLSWTAPSSGSAPTGYTISYSVSGGAVSTITTGPTATSYTLIGLTASTNYIVTVQATNSAGNGPVSSNASLTTKTATTTPPASSSVYTVTAPTGVVAGQFSTVTMTMSGLVLPLRYALDGGTFMTFSPQPAAGATTFTFVLPGQSAGTHSVMVQDANNVTSNNGVATTFVVSTASAPVQLSAIGVPSEGFGFYGNPKDADFNANYDRFVAKMGMHPTHILWFGGDFDSFDTVLGYARDQVNAWASNSRINGESGRPIVTPILSLSLVYKNGGMTFDTLQAGTNNAQLAAFIKIWADAGFLHTKVRLGYEDNYPTTPGGQGANWAPSFNTPEGAEAWRVGYAKAFRAASRAIKAGAAAIAGATTKAIWGMTYINYCFQNPRDSYPDNPEFTADGYGSLVDIHGPDMYSNQFFGPNVLQLHPGYENKAPFTYEDSAGQAPDIPTWAANGSGRGNKFYGFDFISGGSSISDARSGWSVGNSVDWALNCPMGPKPMCWPEAGTINGYEGNNGGLIDTVNGDGKGGNDLDLAAYMRSRIAAFQLRGGVFLTMGLWYDQADAQMLTFQATFPETTDAVLYPPAAGNGKTQTGIKPVIAQSAFTDSNGGTTISLANAASTSNTALVLAGDFADVPDGLIATVDLPAGFRIGAHVQGRPSNIALSVIEAPASALTNGTSVLVKEQLGGAGLGKALLEANATDWACAPLLCTSVNSGSFTAQVVTQGGSNPLLIGATCFYCSAADGYMTATGGTVLYQTGQNWRFVVFSQDGPGAVTLQHSNNINCSSAHGVGAEGTILTGTASSGGSGTVGGTPSLLNNMRVLNNAVAGNNVITLPNQATPGNHVLLLQDSYNEPSPTYVPTAPVGFTTIGRAHTSDNKDLVAFFGPTSALVNNGVTFKTELNQDVGYGAIVLVETTAAHATATALPAIAGGTPTFSTSVPTQGGTSPLLLTFFDLFVFGPTPSIGAQGGTILYQNNTPNGANTVLCTQAAASTPIVFSPTNGQNGQDLVGLGIELTA